MASTTLSHRGISVWIQVEDVIAPMYQKEYRGTTMASAYIASHSGKVRSQIACRLHLLWTELEVLHSSPLSPNQT